MTTVTDHSDRVSPRHPGHSFEALDNFQIALTGEIDMLSSTQVRPAAVIAKKPAKGTRVGAGGSFNGCWPYK